MTQSGFEEKQSTYAAGDPRSLIGQYRRLGSAGPAYQVMDVDKEGNVAIEVVYSGEKLTYPLTEIIEDPIATTLP